MATRMQQRRGTAAQWTSANPILNAAEIGYETDTNKFKIGDGTNHWADLAYFIDEDAVANYVLDTELGELTQDIVNAALTVGGALTKSYNDSANTITLSTDDSYMIRLGVEGVANAIIDGSGITTIYDGTANTITFSVDTTVIATKAELSESAQDAVESSLVAGSGITKTYDDSANTITLAVDTTVIATKAEESSRASASPVTRFVAPGPTVVATTEMRLADL